MYKIFADDTLIYNDKYIEDSTNVLEPKLKMADNGAGSLEMTIPTTNVGYTLIKHLVTDIRVEKDDKEIWAGRVLSEEEDFWKNRKMVCEGELAFLNDSTQPPAEYHDMTVRGFLETLIEIHNAKVAENRQFIVGVVTVTDPNDSLYRYTNYEKTIDCINDKLIDRLGGHIRVRKEDGVRYIDYLADYPNTNTQTIEFGKNLLDFTKSYDLSDFCTVVVPRGEQLEESDIEALTAYLTVEDVNDGSIYVVSQDAVDEYGWIEKVVDWEDVTTPEALLKKAEDYLAEIQFDAMELELSAVDLHYLNADVESINFLDQIRVISKPHGMDRYFPVREMEIPLNNPESTTFTLGDSATGSLTSVNNQINSDILNKIENIPKSSSILDEAKKNATSIMNMATNGFITLEMSEQTGKPQALYISDSEDYTKATKLWKWSVTGLGYSRDGGQTYDMAMTMDGQILGEMIAAGSISADKINVSYTNQIYNKISEEVEVVEDEANNYTNTQLENYYTQAQTETLIKNSTDDIVLKASEEGKKYTDAQLENYAKSTEVKIEIDGLTSTVSSIKYGGRNLLKNTSDTSQNLGGYPSSGYSEGLSYTTYVTPTETEYILSFDARSTVKNDIIVCYFYTSPTNSAITDKSGNNLLDSSGNILYDNIVSTTKSSTPSSGTGSTSTDGYTQVKLTTSWTRYWVKFTQTAAKSVKNIIVGRRFNGLGSGTIYVKGVKLETGNRYTDWTPAPEEKTSNNSIISTINQSPESVTINADKITLTGNTIINAINNDGSVKIKASKIDLTGYVTANSLASSGTTTIDGSRITTGTIKGASFETQTSRTKVVISGGELNFYLERYGEFWDGRLYSGRYIDGKYPGFVIQAPTLEFACNRIIVPTSPGNISDDSFKNWGYGIEYAILNRDVKYCVDSSVGLHSVMRIRNGFIVGT